MNKYYINFGTYHPFLCYNFPVNINKFNQRRFLHSYNYINFYEKDFLNKIHKKNLFNIIVNKFYNVIKI
jgi:hypothetical protein